MSSSLQWNNIQCGKSIVHFPKVFDTGETLQKHVSILGPVSRLRMCEGRQILNVRRLSECRRWVKEQVSRHYDVDDRVKQISSLQQQQQQSSSWWIQPSAPQVNRYVLSFIIRIETFKFVSCYYIEIEVENNIEFERLGLNLASELVEVMFIFDGCFAARFDFVMCNTACAVKCYQIWQKHLFISQFWCVISASFQMKVRAGH